MNKTFMRKIFKAQALGNMRGNWFSSVMMTAIWIIIDLVLIQLLPFRRPSAGEILAVGDNPAEILLLFIPREITPRMIALVGVVILLHLFIVAPYIVGMKKFYLAVARGERPGFLSVFSVYANIKGVLNEVLLKIIVFVISSLWFVFFMLLPMGLCGLALMRNSANIMLAAVAVGGIMTLLWSMWVDRYNFAFYILAMEKDIGAFSAMRRCFSIMKERTGEAVLLRVSYYFWELACSYCTPLTFVYKALSGTTYAKYAMYFTGRIVPDENYFPPKM